MDNIIEFNAFTALNLVAQDEMCCWLCQKGTSPRALFCHSCGTIQPVRDLDHFTRLGLDLGIDLDLAVLERNYAALKRTLDPSRFMVRGAGERGHAAKQLEALDTAYEVLRDPMRRGRYWLMLNAVACDNDNVEKTVNPMIDELMAELESAAQTAQCDRVAQKAGQAMEQSIMKLMQALRGKNWRQANAVLTELDGLESILNNVRARRTNLTPEGKSGDGVTSVK
jgi:molecular chaperone HscB